MKLINTILSAAVGAVIAGIAFDKYTNGLVSEVIKDAINHSDEEEPEEEDEEDTEVEDEDKKNENPWSSEESMIHRDGDNVIIGSNAFTGLFNCFTPQHNEKGNVPIMIKGYNGVGFVVTTDSAVNLYKALEDELEYRDYERDPYRAFGDDWIYFERLWDALKDLLDDKVDADAENREPCLLYDYNDPSDEEDNEKEDPEKEDTEEDDEGNEDSEDEDDKWDWDGEEPDDNDPNDPGSYLIYNASDELIHMDKYFAHDFMSVLGFNRLSDTDFDHYVMTLDDAFKLTRIMCALYSLDDLNFPAFTRLNDTLKTLNDDGQFIIFENGLEFDPDENPNTEIIGDRILLTLIKAIGFRDINVTNIISHDDALKLANLICPDGKPFNDPNLFGTKFTENEINFINHFVDHVHEDDAEDETEEEETEKQGVVDIDYVTVEESPKPESEE